MMWWQLDWYDLVSLYERENIMDKSKKLDVGQLLTTFTDAVVAHYDGDPCKAGLVLSHLSTGFYCSVCRYRDKWGGGKWIVVSATGKDMEEALVSCASKWYDLASAKTRLGTMLGKDD